MGSIACDTTGYSNGISNLTHCQIRWISTIAAIPGNIVTILYTLIDLLAEHSLSLLFVRY